MGRHTEEAAARDLRALITRIGFEAPLGIFATDGDVGPPCAQVFAGTRVRCLVDASAVVTLPGGGTLGITGLSRNHGRERKSEWLAWLLSRGPGADRRLVISHSPDFVDALPVKVDLVLAGHTHGGQVVIPCSVRPPRPRDCRASTRAGCTTSRELPSTCPVAWGWSAASRRP